MGIKLSPPLDWYIDEITISTNFYKFPSSSVGLIYFRSSYNEIINHGMGSLNVDDWRHGFIGTTLGMELTNGQWKFVEIYGNCFS